MRHTSFLPCVAVISGELGCILSTVKEAKQRNGYYKAVVFFVIAKGVSTTEYGRKLMLDMMMVYDGNQNRYSNIVGHGYKILAEAIEKNLTYEIKCPHLIICGKEDRAGSCIRYLKVYEKDTNKQIHWIDHAGHNSNTDQPEIINELIDKFVDECDINQKKKCGIR